MVSQLDTVNVQATYYHHATLKVKLPVVGIWPGNKPDYLLSDKCISLYTNYQTNIKWQHILGDDGTHLIFLNTLLTHLLGEVM